MIVIQGAALQVFHELVITVLSLNIGLTIVHHLHYHLHLHALHNLKQILLEHKAGVIDFQHEFTVSPFNKEHLSFTRIVTQTTDIPVALSFQHEEIDSIVRLGSGYGRPFR